MNKNVKGELERINQQLKELASIYKNAVSNSGISENELWIWYTLVNMGDKYSQQDICSMWSFSKQTVNTIVTHMVKNNYVTLEVVPGTRNRKEIHLTVEGRKFGESIITPIVEAEARAIEHLTSKEKFVFYAVLKKYTDNLKAEIYGSAS